SGRHLAVLETAASLNLLLYVSLISSIFFPWGLADAGAGSLELFTGLVFYVCKLLVSGCLLAVFETSIAKMRVFRVPQFIGTALMMALLAALLMFVTRSL
ncbi:MAG: formate hydrogenlyase, partial [Lysobacterales bacterium]